MGCVQCASFVVLINNSPSKFFHPSRGLRQDCPLSPFLFLLVDEGLEKIMGNPRARGKMKGVKVFPSKIITHLFFVDDVLLFGAGSPQEFLVLKRTMDLYYCST
jgi:hypothetical protein